MKHLFLTLALLSTSYGIASAQASTVTDPDSIPMYYLTGDEVVNSLEFLPAPPEEDSELYAYDVARYHWGKSLRYTARGTQAVADAETKNLLANFSEAFGYELSWENTPCIYYLITHMREDAGDLATEAAKDYYMRQRPYVVFDDPTQTPWMADYLKDNGSYPSGHSSIGFATALVLSEINPARATEIMKRGYDFGESRVIMGFHFESDVIAGRLVGAAVVPVLHSNEQFLSDLQDAKDEFQRISQTGVEGVDAIPTDSLPDGSFTGSYNLLGQPTAANAPGIQIVNGKKVLNR
ncbi:MAG: phosphatase PAP2 family protein [Bacteroidales bacterium]|nr:phosphatase PAP2 family protein [Bacteroidales bacterium]